MITDKQVFDALHEVMHPENKRNLIELGMIRDIVVVKDGGVTLTLVLPFKEVPIKDDLVHSVRGAVKGLDSSLKVEVKLAEMSQQERAAFMTASEGGPKPAQSANRIAHVIAVMSGKGGVGKSLVSGLLAVALRRQGHEVGVLDADITGPSIPRMFFSTHRHPQSGPVGILPVESKTGIKVMSINLLLPSEDEAVIWRGPLVSGAIKQFWTDVLWGDLDYLIVDLPPGTSDASLTVMQSLPLNGVVLVTSPQGLADMVVSKAAKMAQHLGAPLLGLIENMSYVVCPDTGKRLEVFGPSKSAAVAARFGIPLLGQLPIDPQVAQFCDIGRVEDLPAEEFASIVEKIIENMPETKRPMFLHVGPSN